MGIDRRMTAMRRLPVVRSISSPRIDRFIVVMIPDGKERAGEVWTDIIMVDVYVNISV
jgi:hypothetical protein